MKAEIYILTVIVVLTVVFMPSRADPIQYPKFARKIVEVFGDCQKLKPVMSREDMVKLQMFDQDWGPLQQSNDKALSQRTTFQYRSCSLIKVDVDFEATDSKEVRPTDIISRVSMPYIDARPRR